MTKRSRKRNCTPTIERHDNACKRGLAGAVKACGSEIELAKRLGITRQAVAQWSRVPSDRIVEVETVSGVPRHVLRPDLYQRQK